jgi:hypothetical protein
MHSQANATNLTTNYGTKTNNQAHEKRLSIGTGITEKRGDYTAI